MAVQLSVRRQHMSGYPHPAEGNGNPLRLCIKSKSGTEGSDWPALWKASGSGTYGPAGKRRSSDLAVQV